jgi:outer membrane protein OmpA-like peptidoglycan-associated protein
MKKTTIAVAVAAATTITIAGCAILQNDKPLPIGFNYATVDGTSAGLVRAFDMNGSTVLQFVNLSAAKPKVLEGGQELPYRVVGQYAVLSGFHSALAVKTSTGLAVVNRANDAPATPGLAQATTPPTQQAAVVVEAAPQVVAIATLPAAPAETVNQAAIAAPVDQKPAPAPLIEQHAQVAALQSTPIQEPKESGLKMDLAFESVTRMIPFKSGLVAFGSTGYKALAELLPVAKQARTVTVSGRTDSVGSDTANRDLALARARAVRVAFIAGGVKASKIRTTYCTDCYVQSNDTEDGRAANRRVDIALDVQHKVVASLPEPVYSRVADMPKPLVLAQNMYN